MWAFFTWLHVIETPPPCMCLWEHSLHDCMSENPHHPVCVYVSILYMTACQRNPTTLYVSIWVFFTWLHVREPPPPCMCLWEHSLHDCMWGKLHHPVIVYVSILCMTACERTPTTLYVSMWVFFTLLLMRETPPPCMCLCERSVWHYLYLNHTDGSNEPPITMIVHNSWLHRLTLTFILIQHNSMKLLIN